MSNLQYESVPLKSDFYTQTKNEIKRLNRRDTRIEVEAITALVLWGLLAIAFAVWVGLMYNYHDTGITNVNALALAIQQNVTMLQANVMQIVVENLDTNTTTLQTGTFRWIITRSGELGECFQAIFWVNSPAEHIDGTYEVQNRRIGSLNFTILILNVPVSPLVLDTVGLDEVQVCATTFTPPVAAVDTLGAFDSSQQRLIPFTHSNLNRLSVAPTNCIAAGGSCYISPSARGSAPRVDAYRIKIEGGELVGLPLPAGAGYIRWLYVQKMLGDFYSPGTRFDINEPLQLMLESS